MTSTTINNYYLACAGSETMQFSTGIIAPVTAPAHADRPAEYYNSVTKFLYRWNLGTQAWQPVPKVFSALITQTGVAAPTAVILENTLAGIPVFSRIGVGVYLATLAGAFPALKTLATFSAGDATSAGHASAAGQLVDNNTVGFSTMTEAGAGADVLANKSPLFVLIFP